MMRTLNSTARNICVCGRSWKRRSRPAICLKRRRRGRRWTIFCCGFGWNLVDRGVYSLWKRTLAVSIQGCALPRGRADSGIEPLLTGQGRLMKHVAIVCCLAAGALAGGLITLPAAAQTDLERFERKLEQIQRDTRERVDQ